MELTKRLARFVYETKYDVLSPCIVESRNGIVKRRFGLDLILAYLPETAETEAALNVLAMNLCLRLKVLCAFWLGWICTLVLRGWINSRAFSRP